MSGRPVAPKRLTPTEKQEAKKKAEKAAWLAQEEAAGWPSSLRDAKGKIKPGQPGFIFSKDRVVMMRQLAQLQAMESYKPPTERDLCLWTSCTPSCTTRRATRWASCLIFSSLACDSR